MATVAARRWVLITLVVLAVALVLACDVADREAMNDPDVKAEVAAERAAAAALTPLAETLAPRPVAPRPAAPAPTAPSPAAPAPQAPAPPSPARTIRVDGITFEPDMTG